MPLKKPTPIKVRAPKNIVSARLNNTSSRRYGNPGVLKRLISESARTAPKDKRHTMVLKDIVEGFKMAWGTKFQNAVRPIEALVSQFEQLNTQNQNKLRELNQPELIKAKSTPNKKTKLITVLPGSGRTIPSHKYIKYLEKAYTGEILRLLKDGGFQNNYVKYSGDHHEKSFVVQQKTYAFQRELDDYINKFKPKTKGANR